MPPVDAQPHDNGVSVEPQLQAPALANGSKDTKQQQPTTAAAGLQSVQPLGGLTGVMFPGGIGAISGLTHAVMPDGTQVAFQTAPPGAPALPNLLSAPLPGLQPAPVAVPGVQPPAAGAPALPAAAPPPLADLSALLNPQLARAMMPDGTTPDHMTRLKHAMARDYGYTGPWDGWSASMKARGVKSGQNQEADPASTTGGSNSSKFYVLYHCPGKPTCRSVPDVAKALGFYPLPKAGRASAGSAAAGAPGTLPTPALPLPTPTFTLPSLPTSLTTPPVPAPAAGGAPATTTTTTSSQPQLALSAPQVVASTGPAASLLPDSSEQGAGAATSGGGAADAETAGAGGDVSGNGTAGAGAAGAGAEKGGEEEPPAKKAKISEAADTAQ